jgi:hypothetical protein
MTPVELDSMISSAIGKPIAKQLGWIQDSLAVESLISSKGRCVGLQLEVELE